jgi:holin-like protein
MGSVSVEPGARTFRKDAVSLPFPKISPDAPENSWNLSRTVFPPIEMIKSFSLLLLYQFIGEAFVRVFTLPVPGPVVGMIFLLATLLIHDRAIEDFKEGSAVLLQHLSLFFVPAGIGVIVHLGRIADEWLPILLSILISTFAGMAAAVWVFRIMAPRNGDGEAL